MLEREQAAFAVGSGEQRLAALRRLVELHAGTPQVYRYWGYLWREEWRSGNQQEALEIGEKLLADGKRSLAERTEGAALLGLDYIFLGDRNRAAQTLRRADSLFAEYRAQSPGKAALDRLTAAIETTRSVSLRVEGRYADAEAAIRKSIEAINLAVQATRGTRREGFLSIYESNLRFRATAYGQYATLLTDIGRHVEAEAVARQALQQTTAEDTLGSSVGYWYARIARAQVAQRRYAEALVLVDRALAVYAEAGLGASSERVLSSRTLKLQALLGLERWPEADGEYGTMLASTRDDAAARQTISSPLLRAMLLALTGHGDESVKAIDSTLQYRRRLYGESHPATLEAKAVRAMCLQAQGSTGAALSAYREAFDGLFSASIASTDLSTRGLRGTYLPLTLSAFLRLVAAEYDAGRTDPSLVAYAFTVTDRLRSSTVQQAISDSASRSVVTNDPQLGELVRSEQQARSGRRDSYSAINQHFGEIGEADRELRRLRDSDAKLKASQEADRDKALAANERERATVNATRQTALKAVEALRKRVASYEEEQNRARQELSRRFPAYYALVNPPPVRPAELAKRLAPDEAFVSIYQTEGRSFIWAISAKGVQMHVSKTGAADIATDVKRIRQSIEPGARAVPPPFNFVSAHRLYTVLLQPLEATLAGARSITIAAGESLGEIPFALLVKAPARADEYQSAAWLVRDAALTHVPSASSWLSVRDTAGKNVGAKPFIGFGDPQFSAQASAAPAQAVRPTITQALVEQSAEAASSEADYARLPPLPDTRAEILAMATSLGADPAATTYFGTAASRSRVLETPMRDYRVVAFATHGLKARDLPGLSQPALAMAGAGAGSSPLLTLDDVLRLQLQAEWVVLSACNTAASDGSSDEAISGLGRGFFFAGARSLLVTHWGVESISARKLVAGAFENYAKGGGVSRAQSLRAAQLDFISEKAGPGYGHPFFWAPYAVIGDGTR